MNLVNCKKCSAVFMQAVLGSILLLGNAIVQDQLMAQPIAQSIVSENKILNEANKVITDIDTDKLQLLLEQRPETVLIDLRTIDEVDMLGGTIDFHNNYHIQRGWLEFKIQNIVKNSNTPIVVYCGTNKRSPLAASTLQQMGYSYVRNYAAGFSAWQDLGLPTKVSDKARNSILYSRPIEVADGVWSAIGATAAPNYKNSGHNNNLSFVITNEGVAVINGGDSYLLAWSLHEEIKKITDQPVKYLILENGQGHAMLGASYWREQGVEIIAHEDTVTEIKNRGALILDRMKKRNRDKAIGTKVVTPDSTFKSRLVLQLGDETIEILHLGEAHSPGDTQVWLPNKKVMISGDIAFNERLLPVFENTDTRAWLESWDKFENLKPEIIVPGHGSPTTIDVVRAHTVDYLTYMRAEVQKLLDDGGDLSDVQSIDQSAFSQFYTFKLLYRQNAARIFRAMEFE